MARKLIGQHINMLTCLYYLDDEPRKIRCVCDCGNIVDVFDYNILNGHTRSCGCLARQLTSERSTTHGLSKQPVYAVVMKIISRCYNENNPKYYLYGARGCTVYKPWRDDPGLFAQFLLDHGWKKGMQVDKDIKDPGHIIFGYYPETISIVTPKPNSRHTSRNKYIEYKGKRQCLSAWCEELGLPYDTIKCRINRQKWSIEEAFETPIGERRCTRKV